MTDPISGLIVGGIGLASLVTLLQTCTAGYQVLIASARDIGKQASFLEAKFEIEYNRHRLWGRYIGLTDRGSCSLLRQLPKDMQELIIKVLGQIKVITQDAERLKKKYGIGQNAQVQECTSQSNESQSEANLGLLQDQSVQKSAYIQAQRQKSIVANISRIRKLTWAIEDHEHLEALSNQLEYFNHSLWGSLSATHELHLSQGLPSFVLPSISGIEYLREFKSATS